MTVAEILPPPADGGRLWEPRGHTPTAPRTIPVVNQFFGFLLLLLGAAFSIYGLVMIGVTPTVTAVNSTTLQLGNDAATYIYPSFMIAGMVIGPLSALLFFPQSKFMATLLTFAGFTVAVMVGVFVSAMLNNIFDPGVNLNAWIPEQLGVQQSEVQRNDFVSPHDGDKNALILKDGTVIAYTFHLDDETKHLTVTKG